LYLNSGTHPSTPNKIVSFLLCNKTKEQPFLYMKGKLPEEQMPFAATARYLRWLFENFVGKSEGISRGLSGLPRSSPIKLSKSRIKGYL
jgi:hypothetical protein